MRARVALAALAVALSWSCSSKSAAGAGTTTAATPSRAPSTRQDLIQEAEIAARAPETTNALQVIMKLRPTMIRSRGVISPNDPNGEATTPKVYVDNVPYGSIESLANINTAQIKEIQYIKATDATTRWGTGHTGGVILVVTKK